MFAGSVFFNYLQSVKQTSGLIIYIKKIIINRWNLSKQKQVQLVFSICTIISLNKLNKNNMLYSKDKKIDNSTDSC